MKLLTKLIAMLSLSALVCTPLLASTMSTVAPTANTSALTSVSNDDSAGKPVLTLDECIKSALSINNSLALNSQQSEVLEEQMKAMDNIGAYKYQQLYISHNQNQQQREFLKDKVTADITKRYNSIILIEEEIKNIEANIALQKESIKTLEIQKEAGVAVPLQIDAGNLELKNLEANKLAKEEILKSEKEAFLMLTKKDLNKYALENNIYF